MMNIKEIKEMLQLMQEHGLSEMEIEKDGLKIKLKKGAGGRIIAEEIRDSGQAVVIPMAVGGESGHLGASQSPRASQEAASIMLIKSPMVGTFYAAPAPDQPPFVTMGQRIKEGDVLCIVEAMKLMNEIKSDMGGTVIEIMVQNGQPVEFDQPLFKVQKG